MNLFSKFTVAAVVAASSVLSAAEVIDLNSKDFWVPAKTIKFSEGQMSHTGRTILRSLKPIAIDCTKKYTFEMEVIGGAGEKNSYFLYGFSPSDAKGRAYAANSFQSVAGTFTQVVADAKKGDTELKVKNGARWNKLTSSVIALNAKADFSDVPNRAISGTSIAAAKKDGDNWILTLRKPLTIDIAAGTNIRQHAAGGYYYMGTTYIPANKSVKLKHTITGKSKHGGYSRIAFHPALTHAYIVILMDWNNSKTPITIKNAKLTIE